MACTQTLQYLGPPSSSIHSPHASPPLSLSLSLFLSHAHSLIIFFGLFISAYRFFTMDDCIAKETYGICFTCSHSLCVTSLLESPHPKLTDGLYKTPITWWGTDLMPYIWQLAMVFFVISIFLQLYDWSISFSDSFHYVLWMKNSSK